MKDVVHHLTRVVAALVAITIAGLACAAYNFVDINYEGMTGMQVFGTNDKGLVTGNAFFADGPDVPFVYDPKKQTFTELPPLPGCELGAGAISNSGVVAGECRVSPNLSEGLILKNGTYTRFAYPGFAYTKPRAISSTGLITGYAGETSDNPDVGFIFDPARGTFTDIAIPGMLLIIAQGINAHGRVVGSVWLQFGYAYEGSPEGQYGFVREPSGAVTLFRVDGNATWARGINDAGVIAGFAWIAESHVGFVGTLASLGGFQTMMDAELITVPFAGATGTYISVIDNTGRVVGNWMAGPDGYHSYIATPVRRRWQ